MKRTFPLVLMLIAGCVSIGTHFDPANVPRLQPGMTTIEQAEALFGPPNQIIAGAEGRTGVIWRYVSTSMATLATEIQEVTLVFDADNRLVRVHQLVNVPLSDADRRRLQPVSTVQ